MDKKDSNPKQVYGDTKVGLSSLPFGPIYEIALAMTEGGLKYGKHNYRAMGCKASTYFDAALGHLVSWWEGDDIDVESGLPHLMKAAACLVVVRDSQLMGNDNDDRPIRYPHGVLLRKNPLLQKLLDKYPTPAEPYTEKVRVSQLIPKVKLCKNCVHPKTCELPRDTLAAKCSQYQEDRRIWRWSNKDRRKA